MAQLDRLSLDIQSLTNLYAAGQLDPSQLMEEICNRLAKHRDDAIWIDLLSRDELMDQLPRILERKKKGIAQPLFGIPFAVKDNIDVAGRMTTAGCPAFAYRADKSATIVDRLLSAGAILVGKTNMDQFAAGLTGTRSPYGVPRNPFDARYIPGGSSSGSAVAVATGLVGFALGTDTAGSGRIPSMFNNIVGMKPTRGRLSCSGIVPACKSLDCPSIHALTCSDAKRVFDIAVGFDASDSYSRHSEDLPPSSIRSVDKFRFGLPREDQLQYFGGIGLADLFSKACERLKELGGEPIRIDFSLFLHVATMLYEGPWLAERLTVTGELLAKNPQAIFPVTRSIFQKGTALTATFAFQGMHELAEYRQQTRHLWDDIDLIVVPTAPAIYSISEIEADPIGANSKLGTYTNFANLLDLSAVAVPSGFSNQGLPFGMTLLSRAGEDAALLALGARFHAASGLSLGATGIPQPVGAPSLEIPKTSVPVAVVGAHLSGEPLNYQLTERQATLARQCKTAAKYRLYALPGTKPPKPGMIRVDEQGCMIELEVWNMPVQALGSFVAAIPPPLTIGSVELEDGQHVKCFLCESYAIAGARDISSFGGWRAFLKSS